LQDQGFDVRAIRPPSVPPGSARLRISIHADHEPGVLVRLANAVADVLSHV
jgi:8-amino-7-oxononanoate synthase